MDSLALSRSSRSLFDSVFDESAMKNQSQKASVYFLPSRDGYAGDAERLGLIELQAPTTTLSQARITILTAFNKLDASFQFLKSVWLLSRESTHNAPHACIELLYFAS